MKVVITLTATVQLRADSKIEGNTLSGIAHAFGQRAFVKTHYESFQVGAFDDALTRSDVRAFVQHDLARVLGRQSAGTLRLHATKDGLAYEIDLPNTSYANDLKELIGRGDISEMSFGFIPGKYEWAQAEDGLRVRNHIQVRELVDVSPVSIPAFGGTSIQLREHQGSESVRSQLILMKAKILKERYK